MLFQTLIQLNILILATPALAGWSLLPPVHGMTGCVAGIVWHRIAETPVPKAAAVTETRRVKRSPVLLRPPAPPAAVPAAAPRAALASLPAFPHAARAP